jgi:hypothetical protein
MSDRQSSLDQTLNSVISLLENEQTLKKVRFVCPYEPMNGGRDRSKWARIEGREEGKKQESRIKNHDLNEN